MEYLIHHGSHKLTSCWFRYRYGLSMKQTEHFGDDPGPGMAHLKLTMADFLPKPLQARSFVGDWPKLNVKALLTHEKLVKNPTIEVRYCIALYLVFYIIQLYRSNRNQSPGNK